MTSTKYALHAYVRRGEVERFEPFSRTSFARIYQNRPDGARYAVASIYSTARHAEDYLVWDLYEVLLKLGKPQVPDPPRLRHHDVDAAIMAAALLYGGT